MSSANTARPLHPWNCLSCRQRKLRCDRHHPSCTACVRGQRDCVFPKSGRAYQRPEPQPNRQRAKARKNDLLDKLRQLETVVDGLRSGLENQGLPDQGWLGVTPLAGDTDHPRSSMNAQNTNAPNIPPTEARGMQRSEYVMVRNTDARKGVYIGDKLWATLRREITIVRETFAELEGEEEPEAQSGFTPTFLPSSQSESPGFIFGSGSCLRNGATLEELRPSPPHVLFLWHTYLLNVSPVVHILHVPSVQKTFERCRYRYEELDLSMKPLFFAICTLTIGTLTPEEVQINFGQDREQLFTQLRAGTEEALAQADFINTTSISVVQALTLHLIFNKRDHSARYSWTLIGLLIRIAVSIGLHRDGTRFPNISPFEIENRRRLWWHICLFDERLSDGQVPGFGISESGFDTLPPTNVNDDDLDPDMAAPAAAREGHTDTSLTLVRYYTWCFTRKMKTLASKLDAGEATSETMHEALRDYQIGIMKCYGVHPDESLQWAITHLFEMNRKIWELIIKNQRPPNLRVDVPDDDSFALAVSVLEDLALIRHSQAGQKVAWILQGYMQWQPYVIILSRIIVLDWSDASEKGWTAVTTSLNDVSKSVQADSVWQPLRLLLNKAYRHRKEQLDLQQQSLQSLRRGPPSASLPSPSVDGFARFLPTPSVSAVATPDGQPGQSFTAARGAEGGGTGMLSQVSPGSSHARLADLSIHAASGSGLFAEQLLNPMEDNGMVDCIDELDPSAWCGLLWSASSMY